MKVGDKVYIIESNRWIREATITRISGGMYLIKFNDGGGIQVKKHRLYATEEEAKASIRKSEKATIAEINKSLEWYFH